ncbi:protein of unknown function DUF659 [Dillenia turbinata]|uniref:BED-type domain-containing protein n=1 Tax=Dillenia turbinata TaxID=194707 RepID=A0AAN8V9L0_9MAGN
MASTRLTRQKMDPAWEYCQVIKSGTRVHMKCNFCGKILRGGGIGRLKEHLAGQKGNGSTCSSVSPEIRLSMQQYLEMMLGKRKKKKEVKNANEGSGDMNPLLSEVDTVGSPQQFGGFSGLEQNSSIVVPEGGLVQPVSSSRKKVDPAWEHCQILRDGVRVRLKCNYCGKVLGGGGIYRVKEHLAGQKGNGATCLKVLPDVRNFMQQCLSRNVGKSKKRKFARECTDVTSPPSVGDIFKDWCVLDSGAQARVGSNARPSYSTPIEQREGSTEPTLVSTLKRDPAWKHCRMFKNGDRVQLRCLYCGKMFRGGGIRRIKEHLAGLKGNGAPCERVQPDVCLLMQQSLYERVVKKSKKQNMAEDRIQINPLSLEADTMENECVLDNLVQAIADSSAAPVPNSLLRAPVERTQIQSGDRTHKTQKRNLTATANDNVISVSDSGLGTHRTTSHAHMAIARFLYDVGVNLDAVNSIYFQPMINAIVSDGSGLVAPSCLDLQGWILKNVLAEVRIEANHYMETWARNGCSILVDEWKNEAGQTFINFLVYCPEGTMLLRSVDASNMTDSTDALHELLKDVVGDVGVKNVVQVITNCKEHYSIAGKRLVDTFPSLYWTPCAADIISWILEDFSKFEWIDAVLEQAKTITRFIYNNSFVLNMMRKYTFACDLVVPGITYFAANFKTLKRMVDLKHNLEWMFSSEEWLNCPFSKGPEETLVPDTTAQDKLTKELNSYKNAVGDFGRKMAIRARDTLLPELEPPDPISFDNISILKDWVIGKEVCTEEYGASDRMMVDPPLANSMLLGPADNDYEYLGAGFDDFEIFYKREGDVENSEDFL